MLDSEKRATAGAGYTGGAAGKARAAAKSLSDCHNSTSRKGRQAVPTAQDRPHRRGNAIYLGPVPCGRLDNGVFSRSFDSTRNTLLWGTHLSYRVDLLRLLKREGTHTLRAKDSATRETYTVSLEDFLRQAQPFRSARCGDQLALHLRHWQRKPPPGQAVQLGLFGQRVA